MSTLIFADCQKNLENLLLTRFASDCETYLDLNDFTSALNSFKDQQFKMFIASFSEKCIFDIKTFAKLFKVAFYKFIILFLSIALFLQFCIIYHLLFIISISLY